jgi:hypothetical protein
MPKGEHKYDKDAEKIEAKEEKHAAKQEAREAREHRQEERRDARDEHQDDRADQRDIQKFLTEFRAADELYFADISELNSSRVEGFAFIAVDRNGPGKEDDVINVLLSAENLQAGLHIKHIHGFGDGRDAVTPTIAADRPENGGDGDGFLELAEGAPAYGPILVNLTPFDTFTSDGSTIVFNNSFHLPSGDASHDNAAHAGDAITTFDNLDLNHFVIHGLRVPTSVGVGTPGEVGVTDGDDYKEALPVAIGEIERVSFDQAATLLKTAYAQGFDFA